MSKPDIPILYEDADLLVVEKPAGLLSVPGRGEDNQDCLINRLIVDFPNARIVHRLDMATSGIIIIALNHQTQATISQYFANREIEKSYIAVIAGCVSEEEGTIDLPLICDWENRPKQIVDHENGKSAQTHYQCLNYSTSTDTTRVQLKPITGRSHQLRVHMQALGHPILGDPFYAPQEIIDKSPRLLLHASQLIFNHPVINRKMIIVSPAPF